MLMKGMDKMIAGRVRLLFRTVFFGTIISSLDMRESTAIPTMATDGVYLLFNPEFSDKLSNAEIEGVMAHEVLHVVLMHNLRRGSRDPNIWNQAADYAVNLLVTAEGFTLPVGGLLDNKFKDWTAERIYDYLMANPEEQQPKSGEGEGDPWNFGGVMPAGTVGKDGEPGTGKEYSAEQKAVAEAQTKAKIQTALAQAKKAGQLSANIARLVKNICAPKANWKEILQRFVREKAFSDWDYTQCHTRMLHTYGIINPVISGEAVGQLAWLIDSSGSTIEYLEQFAGELSDTLENYDCEIVVVYCDTKVTSVERFTQDDLPLELNVTGMGGTIQRPGYDWIRDNCEDVTAIIHLTDGHVFDWEDIDDPGVPVLVACTEVSGAKEVPNWAELVDIS